MICLVCHFVGPGSICRTCLAGLRPASEHVLPGGLRLISAFEHGGSAPALIHLLKYRGVTAFADIVAGALFARLPRLPLVPVPRALSRRVRYGIDPALELANRLAARLDVPVWRALRAPLHAKRRAGGEHSWPGPPLVALSRLKQDVVVVDDVVTSGATMSSACRALGTDRVALAVSANVVPTVSSLLAPEIDSKRAASLWHQS